MHKEHHHRKLLPVTTTASTRCKGQDQYQCKSERDAAITCNSNHHYHWPAHDQHRCCWRAQCSNHCTCTLTFAPCACGGCHWQQLTVVLFLPQPLAQRLQLDSRWFHPQQLALVVSFLPPTCTDIRLTLGQLALCGGGFLMVVYTMQICRGPYYIRSRHVLHHTGLLMAQFMIIYYTMLQMGLIILKNTLTLTLLIIAEFTDERYTTINQSTVGRFDPRVLVNCLQAFTPITCKLLTKTLRSKSPAVDWLIVLYYSSVNCTTINATMNLYSTYWSCWRIYTPISQWGGMCRVGTESATMHRVGNNY